MQTYRRASLSASSGGRRGCISHAEAIRGFTGVHVSGQHEKVEVRHLAKLGDKQVLSSRYGGPQRPPAQRLAGAIYPPPLLQQRTWVETPSSSRASLSLYYHYFHYCWWWWWCCCGCCYGSESGNSKRPRLASPARATESRHCCHSAAACGTPRSSWTRAAICRGRWTAVCRRGWLETAS